MILTWAKVVWLNIVQSIIRRRHMFLGVLETLVKMLKGNTGICKKVFTLHLRLKTKCPPKSDQD